MKFRLWVVLLSLSSMQYLTADTPAGGREGFPVLGERRSE